jgi:hypothetical protein
VERVWFLPKGKTGEQRLLTNVYYIPSLRSNITSLGQASKCGSDIRIKDDYFSMHDSQGKLLMKVKRTLNRPYKIKLKAGRPVCLQSHMEQLGWLWHARLGHVNFESIKFMATKEMVTGISKIDHEN